MKKIIAVTVFILTVCSTVNADAKPKFDPLLGQQVYDLMMTYIRNTDHYAGFAYTDKKHFKLILENLSDEQLFSGLVVVSTYSINGVANDAKDEALAKISMRMMKTHLKRTGVYKRSFRSNIDGCLDALFSDWDQSIRRAYHAFIGACYRGVYCDEYDRKRGEYSVKNELTKTRGFLYRDILIGI